MAAQAYESQRLRGSSGRSSRKGYGRVPEMAGRIPENARFGSPGSLEIARGGASRGQKVSHEAVYQNPEFEGGLEELTNEWIHLLEK